MNLGLSFSFTVLCLLGSSLPLALQPGHAGKFAGLMLLMRFIEKIRHAVGEVSNVIICSVIHV